MSERLAGLLLFLPVPLVLWLFTRAPLGVAASLGLGVVLMGTHRLYARPWALARAGRRCLWCGRAASDGPGLTLAEPPGTTAWRACGEAHASLASRVFAVAWRWRWGLWLGILGGLVVFVAGAAVAAVFPSAPFTFGDASAFLRLAVALAVTPFGWLATRGRPAGEDPVRVPFPVHVQALIGTYAVLWLFRLVGIAWFVTGLRQFVARP